MRRPSRPIVTLALLFSCALAWTTALAQEAPPASVSAGCSRGEQTALAEIGCEIGRGAGDVGSSALVVVAPAVSDRKLVDARALSLRLGQVVTGALGSGAQAAPEPASLAHARTLSRKASRLVYVAPEVRDGQIRVTADVYPVHRSFWDRVRFPSPAPLAHMYVSRRLDAEVASFHEPVPLVASRIDKATLPFPAVAVGCGDLEADGSLELVLVGRQHVATGRVRGGRFVTGASAAWADLSAVAPTPLRQPIASANVEAGRYVEIGISDRASGVRLLPDLSSPVRLGGAVPWGPAGCLGVSGTALGSPKPCARGEPGFTLAPRKGAPIEPLPTGDIDALASTRLVTPAGGPLTAIAYRSPDARARVLSTAGHAVDLEHAGAALALGDLDLDGAPELVHSEDTLDPREDAIVVRTLRDGALAERARVEVPVGVAALAVCPAEQAGISPIVAATGDGLWIIR